MAATSANSLVTGGLGSDTYATAETDVEGLVITDAGGAADTLLLQGATADLSGVNGGATLAAMGIEQLVYSTDSGVITVAPGQLGAQAINAANGVGGTAEFTLGTAGALNASGLVVTQLAAGAYLSAAGAASAAGVAVTDFELNGSAGDDTITGSALVDVIDGGDGTDTMTGNGGVDVFTFALGDNAGADGAAVPDIITDFVAGTDNLQFAGVVDVVSVQQAAVQAAVTALAAGSTDAQIATAMALANTTDLGVAFAVFNGNTYVYHEATGATATHVEAGNLFIQLTGVTVLPTFAADVVA
jgi:Ca2+-binding RTX toxin-like protein